MGLEEVSGLQVACTDHKLTKDMTHRTWSVPQAYSENKYRGRPLLLHDNIRGNGYTGYTIDRRSMGEDHLQARML